MKLNEFEDHLRSGLAPADPSPRVSSLIDQKLIAVRRRKAGRRRFALAFATTAFVGVALLVLPTVIAQAELRRMAGAMDGVQSVVITRETISPDGSRQFGGRMAYFSGRWRFEMPNASLTYFIDGTRYRLDENTKRFVVETGLAGPFGHNSKDMKLSTALGDIAIWGPHSRVNIDQTELRGKRVTRAVVEDTVFKSRQVLFADIDTDLPIETDELAMREGRWATVAASTYDYSGKQLAKDFVPDLKTFPAISKKQWSAEMVGSLTKQDLGSVDLVKGRLVIRSIDVAKDGTVFVSCQAYERIPRWDRGYPVDIVDDLGTTYALMHVSSRIDEEFISSSADGKLELCVFVPITKSPTWEPKTITVTARLGAAKNLLRLAEAMWGGHANFINGYSWRYDDAMPFTLTKLVSLHVDQPTTDAYPSFASLIDPSQFDNPQHFEEQEYKSRADYYRNHEKYADEKYWLNQALPLIQGESDPSGVRNRLEQLKEPGFAWSPK